MNHPAEPFRQIVHNIKTRSFIHLLLSIANRFNLSMNPRVLPASWRQTNRRKALPARYRQHLGGAVSLVRSSRSQCMRKNERGLSMIRPTPDPSREGSRPSSSSSCSFSSSIGWLVFEEEDEHEDESVHGPNARPRSRADSP